MKLLITLVMFSLFSRDGVACDCTGGPFIQSARDSLLVASVEVETQKGSWVKVKIKELLRGQESRNSIKVQGDRGADCLSSVQEFKPGSGWILALEKDKTIFGDYQISSCGHHYAKFENGNVVGYLTHTFLESKEKEKLSISEFKKRITSAF